MVTAVIEWKTTWLASRKWEDYGSDEAEKIQEQEMETCWTGTKMAIRKPFSILGKICILGLKERCGKVFL